MMFPKPTYPKQKKAKNNKRLIGYHQCERCGAAASETHELWGGPLRQICIEYGIQKKLCHACHQKFTEERPEIKTIQFRWRQEAQRDFEARWGHEFWMQKIGRNYL